MRRKKKEDKCIFFSQANLKKGIVVYTTWTSLKKENYSECFEVLLDMYSLDGSEEGQDIFVGGALDKGVGY